MASRFYFVMEYASGGSLVDFVRARVRYTSRSVLPLTSARADTRAHVLIPTCLCQFICDWGCAWQDCSFMPSATPRTRSGTTSACKAPCSKSSGCHGHVLKLQGLHRDGTLHAKQGGGRRLAEGETRRVFAQIIDAVDYCHRRWPATLISFSCTAPYLHCTVSALPRICTAPVVTQIATQSLSCLGWNPTCLLSAQGSAFVVPHFPLARNAWSTLSTDQAFSGAT